MKTIKGPGLLIAQLADERPPFNTLPSIAEWAAGLGYKGLQLPSLDARFIDVCLCAESQTYADELVGATKAAGLEITELAPPAVRGNSAARQAWAVERLKLAAKASRRLGLSAAQCFTGSLAWPYVYP